jgi:heptosyltransferase III
MKSVLPPLFFSLGVPTRWAIFWSRHLRRSVIASVGQKEPLSIIVFRLDALGDLVLTTPLFRALKQAHPGSRCTVVVQECYKALLLTNPSVDEILTPPRIGPAWLPRRLQTLLSALALYWTRLRHRHFDYALSPRWDTDERLATFLCALTDASHRVGYGSSTSPAKVRMNRGFDAAYDICLPPGPVRHELLRNLALAVAMGASATGARPEIQLTERDRRRAAKLVEGTADGRRLIAAGIGAQSPGRRWPLKDFSQVLNQLAREQNARVAIICSESERGEALQLSTLLGEPPVIVSGAGLREVCAVLERCRLFVGNDSGPAHLAAAMHCPTIVISRHPREGDPNHFNSPARFAPCGAHVHVLQPTGGRDDCRTACRVLEPHCILNVTAAQVCAAASSMLASEAITAHSTIRPWSTPPSQRLLAVHSAEAMLRAVENLRHGAHPPAVV